MRVPSRFADLPGTTARLILGVVVVLALSGVVASFLVHTPARKTTGTKSVSPESKQESPDLKAFRQTVERVRAGDNYYDATGPILAGMGFRTGSVFNWRLPTYAWVLSLLPDTFSIKAVLGLLALVAMVMTFAGEARELPPVHALSTVVLLVGVAKWVFDGDACYSTEVWAAVLLLLSVASYGVERRGLAVAAGLAGLAFRELMLPYCLLALGCALWRRRRWESLAWMVGITLFGLYLAWHAQEVNQRIAEGARGGTGDWISFGGYSFVLATVRMNGWLFPMPLPVLAVYLELALFGLVGWRSERGTLVTLVTLAYLAAFTILGLPGHLNYYWGLLTAPLLCFGPARAPHAMMDLLQAAGIMKPRSIEGPPCSS